MPDPILNTIVGAGTATLVNLAWDSGKRWLAARFADHQEKARKKGIENALKFLRELGERVDELEKTNQVSEQSLSTALEHPDFSVFFQKALLSAAQTDNRDKHLLLSGLVEERLQASPEALRSLASKMACDVIAYITPNQLQILGLAATVMHIGPLEELDRTEVMQWLQKKLPPFMDVNLGSLNYTHLESLSCVSSVALVPGSLPKVLRIKFGDGFDASEFLSTQLGQDLRRLWEEEDLQRYTLTTVGKLLGVMVSDLQFGDRTDLSSWE